MPRVIFAQALKRHIACPPLEVAGASVRDVLDAAFAINPRVRSYVLDDQSHVRKHMIIFVDGRMIRDRTGLSELVTPTSEIYIVQALSGG